MAELVKTEDKIFWMPFYQEFADKLLLYKNNRTALIELIKRVYSNLEGINLPKLENGEPFDVDPFTVFGFFNKNLKTVNRIYLINEFKKELNINSKTPTDFSGIPVLNAQKSLFYYFAGERKEDDIDNLWELFDSALNYAFSKSENNKKALINLFDKVTKQKGVSWNITMGLFWIRPFDFINLDSCNRNGFIKNKMTPPADNDIVPLIKKLPSGEEYLKIIGLCEEQFKINNLDFPTISRNAWLESNKTVVIKEINEFEGWWPSLEEYNPDLSKEDWKKYIIEIEKPNHPSIMQMLKAMLELGGEASCKEISEKFGGSYNRYLGCTMNLGRRAKAYFELPECFDKNQERYFAIPFLGKYSKNNTYIYKMRPELKEALLEIDLSDVSPYYSEKENEEYTKEDFLKEVYITEEKYDTCVSRLKHKKNIILQGAPGVGKTFAAKRLAYSVMGVKDDSRVEFVQFHQSYSYEDFIMGYKPSEKGFSLEKGVFYNFCIKAKNDSENDYFFIIDEINRGNMSKIFGELLMLIESDYRTEKMKLAYSKEEFSVPDNLYIIGMMNTADRSLAMIDYALRRRFSFIEMSPGFDSDGFKNYQLEVKNPVFDKLISRIKALNADIENDASLGKGFCIGHSYFCNLEQGCDNSILKEIAEYDIIPMLEEYWFDDADKVKAYSNDLRGVFNEQN